MDEEIARMIVPCREESLELIEYKYITASCMYNAFQTDLFYAKLTNYLYVKNQEKKGYKCYKKMKDNTIVMYMMCTAADVHWVPLEFIGKSKNPICIELLRGEPTSLPYKDQPNAWFEKSVYVWWINNVFWTNHLTRNGEVNKILNLGNF